MASERVLAARRHGSGQRSLIAHVQACASTRLAEGPYLVTDAQFAFRTDSLVLQEEALEARVAPHKGAPAGLAIDITALRVLWDMVLH